MTAVVQRRGLPAAWWGMAMVVAAEATLIAVMLGSYFYLRLKSLQWPPAGFPEPKVATPLIWVGVLVLTSVPMQFAYLRARGGRLQSARMLLLLALLVQIAYFVGAVDRYRSELRQSTPQGHAYGSIYYTLLGADHAHVFAGLLMSAWLLAKLVRGLTRYRLNALLGIAFYWHAVNALTIVVTLTVVSPAL